ncbi:MAG: hypothetical protein K0R28_4860 [Paenibacillus sp.]|jgi:hypothetical protein|nr:hypothetical protein [Paenibacillus sp.]
MEMSTKSKNVTFTLPPDLVDKYKFFANHNFIPSVNAGVKEALEEYSKKLEKEMLKNEMIKAAQDPVFMNDLMDSIKAFDPVDGEANKEIPEW